MEALRSFQCTDCILSDLSDFWSCEFWTSVGAIGKRCTVPHVGDTAQQKDMRE